MSKFLTELKEDLKKVNWRNYKVWVGLGGLLPLMLQTMGIYQIPDNYADVVNSFLTILVALGILTNPGAESLDKVVIPGTTSTNTESQETTSPSNGPSA